MHTPAPVSNLDARLTDAVAAASPTKPADVFAATATFTPPQSPSRQAPGDTADGGTLATLTAVSEAEAAGSPAQSPLRTPPPLRQAPPSPVSQLGGYDEQELVTITPPPEPAGMRPSSPIPFISILSVQSPSLSSPEVNMSHQADSWSSRKPLLYMRRYGASGFAC